MILSLELYIFLYRFTKKNVNLFLFAASLNELLPNVSTSCNSTYPQWPVRACPLWLEEVWPWSRMEPARQPCSHVARASLSVAPLVWSVGLTAHGMYRHRLAVSPNLHHCFNDNKSINSNMNNYKKKMMIMMKKKIKKKKIKKNWWKVEKIQLKNKTSLN